MDLPSDPNDLEFGVPFPGRPVSAEQQTQTALKQMPTAGWLDWDTLFGRALPRCLDLGCGNGRSTITLAMLHPDHNWLGIDQLPLAIRYAVRRANQRGLANVRFAVADAGEVLRRLIEPRSLLEIHLYHPQPYYDLAQVHRRLVTPEWVVLAYQALRSNGRLFVQTDNPGYWRYMLALLPLAFQLEERQDPWPWAPSGISRREILARQEKLTIYRGIATPLPGLNMQELRLRGEALPPPVFDADRRQRRLDQAEGKFNCD